MRSLNTVFLLGNVGNDPETRSTTGGTRVANFSLATSEQWTDDRDKKQEKTQWHRCVAWGKLADIVDEYVRKGDKLHIAGKIEYQKWEDKDGETRYSTNVVVTNLIMLGGSKRNDDDRNETAEEFFDKKAKEREPRERSKPAAKKSTRRR